MVGIGLSYEEHKIPCPTPQLDSTCNSRSSTSPNQSKTECEEVRALLVFLQAASRAAGCWRFCRNQRWHFASDRYQV